jgi:hypothetical protein
MEKFYFDEPQPQVQISNGKALVLLHEKVEERTILSSEEGGTTETLTQYVYDGAWIPDCTSEQGVLAAAKAYLTSKVTAYDASSSVNGFKLNGMTVWLDKDTRVGLMNSTTIAKNMGNATTTLWLGGMKLEIDCDKAIALLSALEMYALECFNVTAQHKAEVEALTSLDEVAAYDYKAGYPDKLEMSI